MWYFQPKAQKYIHNLAASLCLTHSAHSEVVQADAELRDRKKTMHEESQARYQKRLGAVDDGKDEGERDEMRPIVFD